MAWMQIHFKSSVLNTNTSLNVLLPADPSPFRQGKQTFKTVYLLHGVTCDNTDWMLNTDLVGLAQSANVCIVAVSGGNSYYVDFPASGMKFSSFVGKEVVEFTRSVLPLSDKREDTIIAGLSMGGYGALYNGLKYCDTFGHIIALSSASGIDNAMKSTEEQNWLGFNREFYRFMFGGEEAIANLETSEYNLPVLAKRVLDRGTVPNTYIACGWNDFLIQGNRDLTAKLNALGYPHFYEEGPGTHEWSFWQKFLRRGLERVTPIMNMSMKGTPLWVNDPRDDAQDA